MKPLNFDNSPCTPTSSNCVIWGGPDLACINLCKGDNITEVVAKLATELCTILDTLNINSYDLDCFNLANCSPQTFTDLINFLIVKVCELENIPVDPDNPVSPDCPSNCIVDIAPCFIVGSTTTMSLTNYAIEIGEKVCALVDSIALLQVAIDDLDVRVTTLENTVPPSYTTPTMVMADTLPSVPPLTVGSTQGIDTVIRSFVNQIWFPFVATTGDAGELSTSISNETVAPTDMSKVNPAAQMSAQYAGLWTTPTGTIAGTINNIWACIEDLRNAPTVRTVTGLDTDNTDPSNPIVKIAVGTGISGLGTPASPIVNSGVTQIVAGTNVTISPVGGTGIVTVNSTSGAGSFSHYIGELYGGGIIVYLWKEAGVEKGLIASVEDLGSSANFPWTTAGFVGVACPGATSSFDGATNTTAIVAQAGAGTTYAAGLCDAYTGGGFTDWYLPSIWELNLCNQAAFVVNTVLPTGVFDASYWSSTDYSIAGFGYAQIFNLSSGDDVAKNVVLRVRAVRKF